MTETIEIPTDGTDASTGAAIYLSALAHPTDYDERRAFLIAVTECYETAKRGRKLGRPHIRAINRTGEMIYQVRLPAAFVARQVSTAIIAEMSAGSAIQINVADDLTVRKVAAAMLPRFPKYNTLSNFWTHIWGPSKSVLHLGIGFMHHALARSDEPIPLIPLIARPAWLAGAVRNAQFHAVLLRKSIHDSDGLMEINPAAAGARIDLAAAVRLLPNLTYKARFKNAITRALLNWR